MAIRYSFKLYTLILAACTSPLCGTMHAQDSADRQTGDAVARVKSAISMIAKGEANERQAIISKLLEERGIASEPVAFDSGNAKGTNLRTELSGQDQPANRWLILGAHLDRVAVGQGIIDNGCGCIALMELSTRLKSKPLPNLHVTAMYFDLEERGLLGSKAFAKTLDPKPLAYLNLDVFAYGRQMWLHTADENDPFVSIAKKVDESSPLTLEHGLKYPPSDHLSFRGEKIYAMSYSLLPPDEVKEVESMFEGQKIRPKILATIHTPEDQPEKAVPQDILDGVDFLEKNLRAWAEEGAKTGKVQ